MDHNPKVDVLGSERVNISDRIDPCIASQKKTRGRWRFGLYVCVMSRGRRGLRRGEYLRSMHGRCAARASRDSAQLTRRTACSDIAVLNTLRSPRYGFGSQDVMHA